MPAELTAARPLPHPHQPPTVSQAKAHQILSQHQFQASRPSGLDRVWRWLGQHVGSWLDRLSRGGWGALIGWTVLLVVVALVVVVAVVASRGLRRDPEVAEEAIRVEPRRSATDWLELAQRHEDAGEWKEGLRARYRALVVQLVEAEAVPDLPGRTTGEHRRDLTATVPEASADFTGATELFERAWYGDRPTGATESRRFAELADEVIGRARSRRARLGTPDGDHPDDDRADDLVGVS